MPRAVRDEVNRMLDDGQGYKKIIEWLAANGHPGVNHDHISNWKDGGYQDWVELQLELARQEKVHELSYKIATANEGNKTQEAAIQIAANFLFEVFRKFDSKKLIEQLDLDPKHIPTVLNAFTRLNRRAVDLDLIKDFKKQRAEERKAAAEKGKTDLKAGLSDEGEEKNRTRLEPDVTINKTITIRIKITIKIRSHLINGARG